MLIGINCSRVGVGWFVVLGIRLGICCIFEIKINDK